MNSVRRSLPNTSYLGVLGRNGFRNDGTLFADSKVQFADIRDGQSNTILIGERPPSSDFRIGWWYGFDT